jgi:plasmid stability protein
MATITIRGLPDEIVERVKAAAERNRRSMEQELRELIADRYARRETVLARVSRRWRELPDLTAEEVDDWIETGRRRREA